MSIWVDIVPLKPKIIKQGSSLDFEFQPKILIKTLGKKRKNVVKSENVLLKLHETDYARSSMEIHSVWLTFRLTEKQQLQQNQPSHDCDDLCSVLLVVFSTNTRTARQTPTVKTLR